MHDSEVTSCTWLASELFLQVCLGGENAVHMCVRYGLQDDGMHKAWFELTDPRSTQQRLEARLLYAMELDEIVEDRPSA